MTDNKNNKDEPPSTPERPSTPEAELGHRRRASVPLSPFWASDQLEPKVPFMNQKSIDDDNEAIASPRVHSHGIIEVPMDEIAFFPLPLDDAASDERALPPEKRPSRRASTSRPTLLKVPSVVAAVEKPPHEGAAADQQAAADMASVSSDTTVASSESVHSEFSENTAGSKSVEDGM